MKTLDTVVFSIAFAAPALAQEPLGAIDWLNDPAPISVARPLEAPLQPPPESDVEGAVVPDVDVMPLDGARPDAAGLLPGSTTGLPPNLWAGSSTDTLISLFSRLPSDPLPAIQALYYTLLLAEAEAPADAGAEARFLRARLGALRKMGAVEPALALVQQAGPYDADLFDQWFDLALLSGTENEACSALTQEPELSDRYDARIYCGARTGDWQTAALTYETATALGVLDAPSERLLAHFLDPETIDADTTLAPAATMTPLLYRLYEAAGTPLPTRNLPREFAVADMRGLTGLKAEIEAAERLTRTGALPANRLLGLYTDQSPAASGGVWERVAGVQDLEQAILDTDAQAVGEILPDLWRDMKREGLGVAFATLFAQSLSTLDLQGRGREAAFEVALLSQDYESLAPKLATNDARGRFLVGLAQGTPDADLASETPQIAIAEAFAANAAHPDHADMLEAGRLGQAILTAALQLDGAGPNQASDIVAGLSTLRAVGLEDTARKAALQILLLKAGT
ncbi:hypothetical protein FIU85_00225 [Roseovarius sp. THAF8]|uniref:hypothetical protein n=1 Tax=Roseovarius sp. THAF8 TaxID=2587846 RepID=UPI001268500E|nr:hypothetical protein [Roseovarius sp. THAF8]QFT95715.1 hypothetical protein FIU85_00225 [Roseovarius sp. THAF8]